MVYASTTRALACLETLVHLSTSLFPFNRYLVEIVVPATLWEAASEFDPKKWVGWDAEPIGAVSLNWGTRWVTGMTSVLARVPSVIVPEEFNVLINPAHPDAGRIKSVKVRKWLYDPRLGAR